MQGMAATRKMEETCALPSRGLGERFENLSVMDVGALIAVCVGWLSVVLALGVDLLGIRRRGVAFRWMGAGLLIGLTGVLLSQFAHIRKWPPSHVLAIDTSTLVLGLLGMALVITSLVITARARHSTGTPPPASG